MTKDGEGELVVASTGDLKVAGVAFDADDGFAQSFDEGGVIGDVSFAGFEVVEGIVEGSFEHVEPEALGGLDFDKTGAVDGVADVGRVVGVGLLKGAGDGKDGDDGVVVIEG